MVNNIFLTFKSFLLFIVSPKNRKYDNNNSTVFTYIIVYLMVLLLAFLIRLIIPALLISVGGITLIDFEEARPPKDHSLLFWLFMPVLGGVVEELTYRYPLKYTNTSLIVGLLAYYISFSFMLLSGVDFSISRSIVVGILVIILFLLRNNVTFQGFMEKYWNKSLLVIIYVTSFYFAMCHFDFPIVGTNWILMPFMVFVYFIGALYYSFLRLKKGFKYNLFFHVGRNFIFSLLFIISELIN